MVREILVAEAFGVSEELDTYYAAILIPTILVNVVFRSLGTVATQRILNAQINPDTTDFSRLIEESISWLLCFIVVVSALFICFNSLLTRLLFSSFSPDALEKCISISQLMVFLVVFGGSSAFLSCLLEAQKSFAFVGFSQIIPPAIIIIFLLLSNSCWSMSGLVAGTLIGVLLNFLFLLFAYLQKNRFSFKLLSFFRLPSRHLLSQFLSLSVASLVFSGSNAVDQQMASLLGPGSISSLNFSNKLISIFGTLLFTPLVTVIYPHLIELQSSLSNKQLLKLITKCTAFVVLAALPITIAIIIFSPQLVSLTFERGKFTQEAANIVSLCQMMYAVQLPFQIGGMVLARLASAMSLNHILLRVGVIGFIANIALNILLMKYLDVVGLALSTSLIYLITFFFLIIFIRKKLTLT